MSKTYKALKSDFPTGSLTRLERELLPMAKGCLGYRRSVHMDCCSHPRQNPRSPLTFMMGILLHFVVTGTNPFLCLPASSSRAGEGPKAPSLLSSGNRASSESYQHQPTSGKNCDSRGRPKTAHLGCKLAVHACRSWRFRGCSFMSIVLFGFHM